MKKKLFAALTAALLLGSTTMAAPVSAAETCKKGDVNMDGEITVEDAQMILVEYVCVNVSGNPATFTAEQEELAAVLNKKHTNAYGHEFRFNASDATAVLQYSTAIMAGASLDSDSFFENIWG